MKELVTTNILVIGKTGVGKSSLLNYIFNREVEKTGTGEPVTQKGIFPHEYEYDDTFHLNIYDTWGLEPDKSEEWKDLIVKEVQEHDKSSVSEWFSTIVFCISAGGGPLQDFEIKTLKELLKDNNQILVVITKTDSNNQKAACDKKVALVNETGIDETCVILANSVKKTLISGKQIEQYGRDKILSCIIHNLWMTYKKKTPHIISKNVEMRMNAAKASIHDYIDSTPISIFSRDRDLAKVEKRVNEIYKDSIDGIFVYIQDKLNESIQYFNALSKKYIQIDLDFRTNSANDIFVIDFDKEYVNQIDSKFSEIKKLHSDIYQLCFNEQVTREVIKEVLITIKRLFQTQRVLKADLKRIIDDSIVKSLRYIYHELGMVVEKINEIDFDEIYISENWS